MENNKVFLRKQMEESLLSKINSQEEFSLGSNFPLKKLSDKIKDVLEIENFKINFLKWEYKKDEADRSSKKFFIFSVEPLPGTVKLLFSKVELISLMQLFVKSKSNLATTSIELFLDDDIFLGFCDYITNAIAYNVNNLEEFKDLTISSCKEEQKNDDKEINIFLEIVAKDITLHPVVFCSKNFALSWKKSFSHVNKKDAKELKKDVKVHLGCEIDKVKLTIDEWKKAKEGDVLILNNDKFDEKKFFGKCFVTSNGKYVACVDFQEQGMVLLNFYN